LIEKRELVIATRNRHKIKELSSILSPLYEGWKLLTLEDTGFYEEIEEGGDTYRENALLKARIVSERCNKLTAADDSGLEIDYLKGLPGVKSARFISSSASFEERNTKVLEMLSGVPEEKRTARFICVAAMVWPGGKEEVFQGVCEGQIAFKPGGKGGFGYDPVFYIPSLNKTMAEVPPETKNLISHRAIAFKKLVVFLTEKVLKS